MTSWQQWARRFLLLLIVASSAFLAYILLTRTDTTSSSVSTHKQPLDHADAGMEEFVFRQTKDGVVQWEVKAEEASLFEERNQALLSTVQVALLGARGRQMTVHGEEGQLNTQTKDFTLSNRSTDIAVHLDGGYTVYTNHLQWTDKLQELTTEDPVSIEGNGLIIRGRGLRGKLAQEEFQVLENVHVDFLPTGE
ncbi:hypothetical protein YTPLAS18_39830 [Nitrospira sp.]|nr:hypothetical protein YTPLAS18_39830 [Nitrospira sp.]